MITDDAKKLPIAIKIMNDNKVGQREFNILNLIKNKKKNNIHFPIIYKTTLCDINKVNKIWTHSHRPINSSSFTRSSSEEPLQNHYIILNELANGDIKQFKDQDHSIKVINNAIVQIFIAILSLHNIGYNHLDTHWGNFLYHKVTKTIKKEYFYYKINGKKLYLENIGYIFTIWDFGKAKPIKDYYDIKFNDYARILHIINKYFNKKKSNKNMKLEEIIKTLLINNSQKSYEKEIFEYLINNNYILQKKPENASIFNKTPIILNYT